MDGQARQSRQLITCNFKDGCRSYNNPRRAPGKIVKERKKVNLRKIVMDAEIKTKTKVREKGKRV